MSDLTSIRVHKTRWKIHHKQTKKIFLHNSKAWWNIMVWLTDEEIATLEISEHAVLIKRKLEKNGIANRQMHAISTRIAKRIGNDDYICENCYKGFIIMYYLNSWRTRRWKYATAIGLQTAIHRAAPNEGNITIMARLSIRERLSKTSIWQQVTFLTIVGEDYQDIGANRINWAKGRTCKNRRTKIHKPTNAQIDALLTKNHG